MHALELTIGQVLAHETNMNANAIKNVSIILQFLEFSNSFMHKTQTNILQII